MLATAKAFSALSQLGQNTLAHKLWIILHAMPPPVDPRTLAFDLTM